MRPSGGIPASERHAYLNELRGRFTDLRKANPAIAKAPFLSTLGGGLDETMRRGLPVPNPPRAESRIAKAMPALATAGLAAVDPPAAVHGVINAVRTRLPNTEMGRKFAKEEFRRGIERAKAPGRLVNPTSREKRQGILERVRNALVDTALSTMAREASRVWEELGRWARAATVETARFVETLGRTQPRLVGYTPQRRLESPYG